MNSARALHSGLYANGGRMSDDFGVVVVGGSAGSVEGSLQLVQHLPEDLSAAVFICIHLSASAPSRFAELLNRRGRMRSGWARDGERITAGQIYVAPPDMHLLLEGGHICLGRGPRENGHRPAIDPLFRSAAHGYGERVIGVVLSGNLDDGTAGLREIRRMRGRAIIQDPDDALYPSMPRSALDEVGADAVVPLALVPDTIVEMVTQRVPASAAIGELPHDIAAGGEAPMSDDERTSGKLSAFGCPDCGGALWELQDGEIISFRCRVGHAYTDESLLEAQTDGVERAMWAALRALEEASAHAHRLARRMKARGHPDLMERFRNQALDAEERAAVIRRALLKQDVPVEEAS